MEQDLTWISLCRKNGMRPQRSLTKVPSRDAKLEQPFRPHRMQPALRHRGRHGPDARAALDLFTAFVPGGGHVVVPLLGVLVVLRCWVPPRSVDPTQHACSVAPVWSGLSYLYGRHLPGTTREH